jgi:hypothetical protein
MHSTALQQHEHVFVHHGGAPDWELFDVVRSIDPDIIVLGMEGNNDKYLPKQDAWREDYGFALHGQLFISVGSLFERLIRADKKRSAQARWEDFERRRVRPADLFPRYLVDAVGLITMGFPLLLLFGLKRKLA